MRRIIVLGVGNALLGDEGFGVHALRYLQQNYAWPDNVRFVDGGTLGLFLMAELMECDLAVILDVARGGCDPGTFYRIEPAEIMAGAALRQSQHQTGIADALMACELAGACPEVVIFAMEPFDMTTVQIGLTAQASARLPEFCARVASELRAFIAGQGSLDSVLAENHKTMLEQSRGKQAVAWRKPAAE
ncbi:MAG: hydrogenase maturation protease [Desulfovibrio sp.]|nr:hydrogenase maturation protease [Desulfovibrio sp.]